MEEQIRTDKIIGSRRFSNYFWAVFLTFGGLGFLLAGLSSYYKTNFLPFSNPSDLAFLPQGLIMMFYGTLSIGLSSFITFNIALDIGGGYNEYNKLEKAVTVVRKGFPGINRQILLIYSLTDIRAIGIKITEGLNPTRRLYLCLKDERNIPLTPAQQPISISELEEEGADLAKFLDLNLENL